MFLLPRSGAACSATARKVHHNSAVRNATTRTLTTRHRPRSMLQSVIVPPCRYLSSKTSRTAPKAAPLTLQWETSRRTFSAYHATDVRRYNPHLRDPDGPLAGSEPGIDPANEDVEAWPESSQFTQLTHSQITAVDFSADRIEIRQLDNDSLPAFLKEPRQEWATCRWINVNGLSWDVVRLLGTERGLHRLAIEDLMHTKNRTKADWYPEHVFGG